MKKFTFLMLFLVGSTFGVQAQTITHSNSQDLIAGSGVSCPGGDNAFWRSFVLADFAIPGSWGVNTVEFGIESITGAPVAGYPITVTPLYN